MTPKEQAYFQVLRALEVQPAISQRELARQLGISMGKANYLVNALVEKGLVKIGNFSHAGDKLNKIAYLLTPEGISNRVRLTRSYLMRKEAEYEALKVEIETLRQAALDESPQLLPPRQGGLVMPESLQPSQSRA